MSTDRGVDLVGMMMDWEEGNLSQDSTVELFQHLIDAGTVWQLQGAYGRMAYSLIGQGLCHYTKGHG